MLGVNSNNKNEKNTTERRWHADAVASCKQKTEYGVLCYKVHSLDDWEFTEDGMFGTLTFCQEQETLIFSGPKMFLYCLSSMDKICPETLYDEYHDADSYVTLYCEFEEMFEQICTRFDKTVTCFRQRILDFRQRLDNGVFTELIETEHFLDFQAMHYLSSIANEDGISLVCEKSFLITNFDGQNHSVLAFPTPPQSLVKEAIARSGICAPYYVHQSIYYVPVQNHSEAMAIYKEYQALMTAFWKL